MDRVAIDEWAPVRSGVDLVSRYIGEGYACDLLVSLQQSVLIAVHQETECLDQCVGFSSTGTSFDEKALLAA